VTLTIVVLALTLMAALWTAMTGSLIRAVLGLAATSICLTTLMFMLGAGLAAVFELSVCAGLITVVFVSSIAMTQPATKLESADRVRAHMRRYRFLPVLLVAAGAALAFFVVGLPIELPPPIAAVDVRKVLWESRQTDLLGQVIVLLAGVFGVVVLFKERNK
jgi:NADH-quinone oxidoreductase subunit J